MIVICKTVINKMYPIKTWHLERKDIPVDWLEVPPELEEKAISSGGYCELVTKEGLLTDIIPTERPQEEPQVSLEDEIQSLKAQLKVSTESAQKPEASALLKGQDKFKSNLLTKIQLLKLIFKGDLHMMAMLFAARIIEGKSEFEKVPAKLKDAVAEIIKNDFGMAESLPPEYQEA